jgi:hypothetical protein
MSDRGKQTEIRLLLRELAALYGLKGIAKSNDSLAMQQIGWAMRKELKQLPTRDSLAPLVQALEQLLQRHDDTIPEADLRMLKDMPDLKAQEMSRFTLESETSGADYTKEMLVERSISCGQLRSLATSRLPVAG